MVKGTFACAINCMDGRVQTQVTDWLKAKLKVDHVDMVTEPGPDRVLVSGPKEEIESIKRRVMISVNAHKAKAVAIISHHDCAGNPVTKDIHLEELAGCIDILGSWDLPVRLLGLWVNEGWTVELVHDVEGPTSHERVQGQ